MSEKYGPKWVQEMQAVLDAAIAAHQAFKRAGNAVYDFGLKSPEIEKPRLCETIDEWATYERGVEERKLKLQELQNAASDAREREYDAVRKLLNYLPDGVWFHHGDLAVRIDTNTLSVQDWNAIRWPRP